MLYRNFATQEELDVRYNLEVIAPNVALRILDQAIQAHGGGGTQTVKN